MTSDIVNMTHIKHMLSPSSLSSKNNRGTCLQRWGKWNFDYSRLGSTSLLNMALRCFVSGWGHLISFSLASMGLGYPIWPLICSLPSPSAAHLMSSTAKSVIVPLYVQEKLSSATMQPRSLSHHKLLYLCLVSMMWESSWPTFDQGHFSSTSAHYPRKWLRDSFQVPWSLHASMAGSSCSTQGLHHWPSIERFHGCSTPTHWFTRHGLYL